MGGAGTRDIESRSGPKVSANRFLQVPPKFQYKRLIIGTKLYLSSRVRTSSKMPEGLKDSKCEKGIFAIAHLSDIGHSI